MASQSGLRDQSVVMDTTVKTALSRSSNTKAKVAAGLQEWGVNARNEKGRTALHFACGIPSLATAKSLVEAGADVNARDQDGCTPLHLAAVQGRYLIVDLLIQHGANVFDRERAGLNPREYTVKFCDESIQAQEKLTDGSLQRNIDLVLQLLADAESKSVDILASATEEPRSTIQRGHSSKQLKTLQTDALGNALTVACRGDVEFVQLLLSGGCPVDFRSSDGSTPLLVAADGGFANCVQLLLDYGANPNATDNIGITALIAAAYKGHFQCLRVLLNHGALINAKSEGGVTPLIAAAEGCSGVCIQALLQEGGEVNAKTNGGKNALMYAVSNNCIEATQALLDGGCELNVVDGEGYTALHYGAQRNSVECIRILLDRGADETRKCPSCQTPREMAPRDSEGAQLLEESWMKLELAIAMRAEELLHQDKLERQSSSTSPKPSTRHAREKKNVKKNRKKKQQEGVEKADHANEELRRDDNESFPSIDMVSLCGSSTVTTQLSSLNLDGDSASNRSKDLITKGFQEHHRSDPQDVSPKQWKKPAINPTPFSPDEDAFENPDEWIRVNGKRTGVSGASVKTHSGSPQIKNPGMSIPSGVLLSPSRGSSSKSGELSSPNGDHLVTERKTLTDSSGVPRNHPKLVLQEDRDSRDLESSPSWVQAVLRRTHSDANGTSSPPKTPPEAGARAGEATEQEETWMKRVERLELELKQARQVVQEKVKQLEILQEANSVQVLELAQSLSRVHHQVETAETAKTEMESRIYRLEAVVASQSQALKISQAENAQLKLQSRRSTSLHAPDIMHSEPGGRFGVGVGAGPGSGLVRSASESSLYSMGCGTEPRSPVDHLPFIPKAGPKTDTDNWFSLVPSPRPD